MGQSPDCRNRLTYAEASSPLTVASPLPESIGVCSASSRKVRLQNHSCSHMGCVSSSVHSSLMDNARDKLSEAQRELDLCRQRISALEDEVRKVRAMDTSQRVLHEQKLRIRYGYVLSPLSACLTLCSQR